MRLETSKKDDNKKIKDLFEGESYIIVGNFIKLNILAVEIHFNENVKVIGTFAEPNEHSINIQKGTIILNMPWNKLQKSFKSELVKLIIV